MKEYLRKYRAELIGLVLVGLIGIPLLIHILFKIEAPCPFLVAEWSAGDVLAFYGVLVGAVVAIAGVYFSIVAGQKNYHDDVINQCRPFMTMEARYYKAENITEIKPDNDQSHPQKPLQEFEEYALEKLYYVIQKGNVQIKENLTEVQQRHVKYSGFGAREIVPGGKSVYTTKMLYLPLEIENVGNGAAVSFSVGINNSTLDEKKHMFSRPKSLKVGQKFYISIYSENMDRDNYGEYTVCISYYDILGNGYEQNYKYKIFEDTNHVAGSLEMDGTQKRQEKK